MSQRPRRTIYKPNLDLEQHWAFAIDANCKGTSTMEWGTSTFGSGQAVKL